MSLAELYESHAKATEVGDFLNGVREHIDRISYVMQRVQELKPNSVLDLACNHGLFGYFLKARTVEVSRLVGVDISPTVLEMAKWLGYDKVIIEDVTNPSLSLDESFDLVLCMEILEHVPDPKVVIQNALKFGKNVLFSTPIEGGPVDGEFHVRHVSPSDLRKWVEECGGEVLDLMLLGSRFCEKPQWVGWTYCLAKESLHVK